MFDRLGIKIRETVEARSTKIGENEAWQLLSGAKEIVVGRGKSFRVLQPDEHSRADILDQCLGRSGTLRAPALKLGDRFLVGFTSEMYETYLA